MTGENAPRGTDHSFIMVGMLTPRSWLSTPSETTVIAVSSTSHF